MYAQLEFPLNVYVYALYLQQGQVDYLHYGLVEADEDAWELGAFAAQQRATDLLLKHLPLCLLASVGCINGVPCAKKTTKVYDALLIHPTALIFLKSMIMADSGFRIALVNRKDDYHQQAVTISRLIQNERLITTTK